MRSIILSAILVSVTVSFVQAAPVKNDKRAGEQAPGPFAQYFGQATGAFGPFTSALFAPIDPSVGQAALAAESGQGAVTGANPLNPGGASPMLASQVATLNSAGGVADGVSTLAAGGGPGAGGQQQEP